MKQKLCLGWSYLSMAFLFQMKCSVCGEENLIFIVTKETYKDSLDTQKAMTNTF